MQKVNRMMVNICSDDLDTSQSFYTSLFDFEVSYKSDWFIHLRADDSGMELGIIHRSSEVIPREFQKTPQGSYITFVVDSVDDSYHIANVRGYQIISEPELMFYGQRRMLLQDPNGILIDISSPA